MDYKEKYEQAIENLKRIKKANRDNKELVDFIEYQYPELKESEDDRIKTNIIKLLKFVRDTNHQYSDECNESIAWLEKQGKVKHTCRNCQTFQDLHQNCPYSPIYQYTDLTDAHKHLDDETHCEFWLEKQGEQKPEIKYIYPKFRVGDVIEPAKPNGHYVPVRVKYIGEGNYSCESDDHKAFLSFPICNENEYILIEQKHVEWNEEDEIRTAQIISDFEKCSVPGFPILINNIEFKVNWLKSLKERMKGE